MGHRASGVAHHGTHQALTGQTAPSGPALAQLRLDAIIVPGSRPAPSLDQAVTLARAADCWLLILCSQRLQGSEIKEFLAERAFAKVIVIELPLGYSNELLDFPALRAISKELPEEYHFYATDLSMKRNIGLVLAKMLGWQRIFFLDDDIRDVAYPDLQATVDMLGSFPAVGMWVTEFPDNSIVCHANRQTEGSQDVFVSGAALAVDCDADIGFFPDIYNEDWLFFFDDVSSGRLANSRLQVTQLAYYPFANAKRAAWQEFGDVLAEGLYSLLHLGLDVQDATPEYWDSFLEARRGFLKDILDRSENADPDIRREMVAAVEAARECLREIEPDLCARYIEAWRVDLRDWKRRMAGITKSPSLEDALERMRLARTPHASRTWRVMPHWPEAMLASAAGPVAVPQIDTLKHRLRDTVPLEELTEAVISRAAMGAGNGGEILSSIGQAFNGHRWLWQRMSSWRVMKLSSARSSRRGQAGDNQPLRGPSLDSPEPVATGQTAESRA